MSVSGKQLLRQAVRAPRMIPVKAWLPVIVAVFIFVGTAAARRQYRASVTASLARGLRGSTGAGGRRAARLLGFPLLAALALVAVGLWALTDGGEYHWVRYPLAVIVLVGYAPIATLGAPKATKWQKGFAATLMKAGASADAAAGAASVARVTSAIGLVVSLLALVLLAPASIG